MRWWRAERVLGVVIFGTVLLPLLVSAATLMVTMPVQYPTDDGAALEYAVMSAAKLDRFLGAYSRFGFYHPGPVAFYLFAPFYMLSPGFSAMQLGAVFLHLILVTMSLGGAFYVLKDLVSRVAIAGAFLGFLAALGPGVLISPWNPVTAAFSFLAFATLAVIALGLESRLTLAVALIPLAIAAQAHILTFVTAWIAGPVMLWFLLRQTGLRQLRAAEISAVLTAVLVSLLLLTPAAVDNLIRFLSWRARVGGGFSFSNAIIGCKTAVAGLVAFNHGLDLSAWIGLSVSFVAVVAAGVTGRIGRLRVNHRSVLGCIVLVLVSSFVVGTGGGSLHDYLMWWVGSVSVVCILTLLLQLQFASDTTTRWLAAGLTAVLLIPSLSLSLRVVDHLHQLNARLPPDQRVVKSLSGPASKECRDRGTVFLRHCGPRSWIPTAGIALELVKRGCDVKLDDKIAFLFGRQNPIVPTAGILTVSTAGCDSAAQGELLAAKSGTSLFLDSTHPWRDSRMELRGSPGEQTVISGFYRAERELHDGSEVDFRWSDGREARILVPQHWAQSGCFDRGISQQAPDFSMQN